MAYPFYPTYQPYTGYLPQNYQPVVQQPTQTQVQQMQNQNSIIWVSGAQEAGMYPVAPNSAVALWEQSGKTIYLKSADATGKPSLRVFDLVERTETSASAASGAEDKKVTFATKDDLDAVVGVIKGITGDIDQIRSDLYGLSGKRKTVKKEVTEDDE